MNISTGPDLVRYSDDIGIRSIILDRDGTINFDETGYSHDLSQLKILPKVREALALASSKNINLYIASNQGGVALGKFNLAQMHQFNSEIVRLLSLSGARIQTIACCVHHPLASNPFLQKCTCRKPLSDLLLQLVGERAYDDYNCLMVGDSISDKSAASSIGMNFVMVSEPDDWKKVEEWINIDDSN